MIYSKPGGKYYKHKNTWLLLIWVIINYVLSKSVNINFINHYVVLLFSRFFMACFSSELSLFKIDIDTRIGTWLDFALVATVFKTWWLRLWLLSSTAQVWGVVLLALLDHAWIVTTCCNLLFLPYLVLIHCKNHMLSIVLVLLQARGLIACTVTSLSPSSWLSVGTVILSLLAGLDLVFKFDALFFELFLKLLDAFSPAL